MTVFAFAGPSLVSADRAAFPGVDGRAPAGAGDLLRLGAAAGDVVCLIDGYFDHRPAVRHKELLLLLSRGVAILGASSIGALRAAEMRPYGMIGVGAVFAAYARGALTGDDEVALVHAGPEQDWRPVSIPLVDVRATLVPARRERAVTRGEARALLRAAAGIHYIDRDWPSVCLATDLESDFRRWLETGAVSQKRADALACLAAAQAEPRPAFARPELVRTNFLDKLIRLCGAEAP